MKLKLLSFAMLCMFAWHGAKSQNQIPNGSFETVTANPSVPMYWCSTVPPIPQFDSKNFTGWATNNFSLIVKQACGQNAHVTQTTTAYSGTSAVRLETVNAKNKAGQSVGMITGFAFTGSVDPYTMTGTYGFPLNAWPTKLRGYYKYTPGTGDSCAIGLLLLKRINSTTVVVGQAMFMTGTTTNSYTMFEVPVMPSVGSVDSAIVFLSSSSVKIDTAAIKAGNWPAAFVFKPVAGSVLFADSLSLVGVPTSVKADFTADTVCAGDSTHFTDLSSGSVVNRSWDFGDNANSTLTTPVHKYAQAGTYTVKYKVSNSAYSDSVTKQVLVLGIKPTASFTTQANGLTINFTNTSSNASGYSWDFGDNTGKSSSQNPSYTYSKEGTYTVKLTAFTKCKDTVVSSKSIIVKQGNTTYTDIPNPGFENWTANSNKGGVLEPDGWPSTNVSPNVVSVVRSTSSFAGSYAIQVKVFTLLGNPAPGTAEADFKYNARPLYLEAQVKANVMANDGVAILVSSFKQGIELSDTLWYSKTSISNYTKVYVPINYYTSETPDSFSIGIIAGDIVNGTQKIGTEIWVDEMKFTNTVDIEQYFAETKFSVFPNPSQGELNLILHDESLKNVKATIYNMYGQVVLQENIEVNNDEYKLSLHQATGLYYIAVSADNYYESRKIILNGK